MEQQITAKEKILKKVRAALINKSKGFYQNIDLESNIYTQPAEGVSLAETFAENFTLLEGQFVFCDNRFDFIDNFLTLLEQRKWKHFFCWEEEVQNMLKDSGITFNDRKENLDKIQAAITGCEALIGRTGSILVSSSRNSRTLTIWPPAHIVVANLSQLVMEMRDGLQLVKNRYGKNTPSMLSIISGPSRTTNLLPTRPVEEETIVMGGHGPTELILFLIDDTKHE